MSAPDTPTVQGLEDDSSGPPMARQRKRKEVEILDERSERMQKRMVRAGAFSGGCTCLAGGCALLTSREKGTELTTRTQVQQPSSQGAALFLD